MEDLMDNNDLHMDGNWKKLWSLKVPQKVKVFLWRAARGCLPTWCRLQTRGVQCGDRCVMCERSYENDWHVFFGCAEVEQVWEAAGLWYIISENLEIADGFFALFYQLLEQLPHQQVLMFVMTLWGIWKRQNDKLWNDITVSASITVHMARESLLQWQQARQNEEHRDLMAQQSSGTTNNDQDRWRRPEVGEVKCNVDAAIFKEQGCYGVGMCLRGQQGEYIKARTAWYQGLPQPHEAKARGLKEALTWLGSLGFSNVSIELDCKQVVDGIVRKLNTNTIFGAIFEICTASLRIYQNFRISLIRRQSNNVAHMLARASLSYASS